MVASCRFVIKVQIYIIDFSKIPHEDISKEIYALEWATLVSEKVSAMIM